VCRYLSSEGAFVEDSGFIRQCCAQWSLSLKHTLSRLLCPAFGRHRGNYLVTLYLLVKLLYIGNVVGQLYMLSAFLGASYHTYGVDVVRALLNGTADWHSAAASPIFPRVTVCDLRVGLYTRVYVRASDRASVAAVCTVLLVTTHRR